MSEAEKQELRNFHRFIGLLLVSAVFAFVATILRSGGGGRYPKREDVADIKALDGELLKAIDEERFEDAALLRDRIQLIVGRRNLLT